MGPTALISFQKKGVLGIFIALAGFEIAILGSNGKHTNHYTMEATSSIDGLSYCRRR
jgi:hypothetical protein